MRAAVSRAAGLVALAARGPDDKPTLPTAPPLLVRDGDAVQRHHPSLSAPVFCWPLSPRRFVGLFLSGSHPLGRSRPPVLSWSWSWLGPLGPCREGCRGLTW